jgi:phosphatidylglycerol:prolipoprotein diacylglycerol transferase
MGLFFGRMANFKNGELWGRVSDVPWAKIFPNPAAGHLPRHPSQLYEAALEGVVLFLVLRWLTHKKLALRHPGMVSGAMVLGYGLARIFVENFRQFDEGVGLMIGPLTPGMIYSLPMLAIGAWLISRARRGVDAGGRE